MDLSSASNILYVVSIPIYTTVLVAVQKSKSELNASFYAFFLSAGISDILSLVVNLFTIVIPEWLFFDQLKHSRLLATLSVAAGWYMWYAQMLGVLNICMDRFTAMTKPLQYQQIWSPQRIKGVIVAQWAFGLLAAVPTIHPRFRAHYDVNSTSLYSIFDYKSSGQMYYVGDITFCVVELAALVYMHLAIIWSLTVGKKASVNTEAEKKKRKVAIKLTIMTAALTVNYIVLMITIWPVYLIALGMLDVPDSWMDLAWSSFVLFLGLFNVQSGYMILLVCTAVRKTFLKMISFGKGTATVSAVTSMSGPRK